MAHVVRIAVVLVRTEPVAVELVRRSIVCLKVLKAYVARHEEQLCYLAVQTRVRTVLCLSVRYGNLAVQ